MGILRSSRLVAGGVVVAALYFAVMPPPAGAGTPPVQTVGAAASRHTLTAHTVAGGPYARPSWWKGACDVGYHPGSYRLTADFDGLQACAPGPAQGGADHLVRFFSGAWGEYEWECVELSMRWMYLAWGVRPYGANGNGVVANYPNGQAGYPSLTKVSNGTRAEAPVPGDVLSIDDSDSFGHTEVIAATSVNSSGNGVLRAITDNWDVQSDGWVWLSVSNWVVSDRVPGNRVLGWLHDPAWRLGVPRRAAHSRS